MAGCVVVDDRDSKFKGRLQNSVHFHNQQHPPSPLSSLLPRLPTPHSPTPRLHSLGTPNPPMPSFISLFVLPWFLRPSRLGGPKSLVLGLTLGFSLSLSLTGLALYAMDAWKRTLRRKAATLIVEMRSSEVVDGVEGLIG